MEPTLESIMFYYTFSVINTIFVPRLSLLCSSNSNIKIIHNSIEYILCNPSDFFSNDVLFCLWIVFTNFVFQVLPQKIVRRVEILGMGWLGVIGFTRNASVPMGSYAWHTQVFCSRNEVTPHISNRTLEYLRHNLNRDKNRDIFVGHPVYTILRFRNYKRRELVLLPNESYFLL